jgi:hypothetical protein
MNQPKPRDVVTTTLWAVAFLAFVAALVLVASQPAPAPEATPDTSYIYDTPFHTNTPRPPTHATDKPTVTPVTACAFLDGVRVRLSPTTERDNILREMSAGECAEVIEAFFAENRWWYRLTVGFTAAEFYVLDRGDTSFLDIVPPLLATPTPEAVP